MAAFDPNHVKITPGTLYAAPIGTTEPTSVTGSWPTGWVTLGYTDAGSEFAYNPSFADVTVEEEYWPVDTVPDAFTATLSFVLAETTGSNLLLAMNAGVATYASGSYTGNVSGTSGANPDGSLWFEPPTIGSEQRVMLGWDSLGSGGVGGSSFERLVIRRALQTGSMTMTRRKGNNKTTYGCQFRALKPTGAQPFRFIKSTALAA